MNSTYRKSNPAPKRLDTFAEANPIATADQVKADRPIPGTVEACIQNLGSVFDIVGQIERDLGGVTAPYPGRTPEAEAEEQPGLLGRVTTLNSRLIGLRERLEMLQKNLLV